MAIIRSCDWVAINRTNLNDFVFSCDCMAVWVYIMCYPSDPLDELNSKFLSIVFKKSINEIEEILSQIVGIGYGSIQKKEGKNIFFISQEKQGN